MEKEVKDMLEQNGFEVDTTLQRFVNNEALYLKCLKKYLDDTNFEQLKEACATGNCQEAFKASHTMKGFVSNLGINDMYHLLTPMVEVFRSGSMDIGDDLSKLEELHNKTYAIIEKL